MINTLSLRLKLEEGRLKVTSRGFTEDGFRDFMDSVLGISSFWGKLRTGIEDDNPLAGFLGLSGGSILVESTGWTEKQISSLLSEAYSQSWLITPTCNGVWIHEMLPGFSKKEVLDRMGLSFEQEKSAWKYFPNLFKPRKYGGKLGPHEVLIIDEEMTELATLANDSDGCGSFAGPFKKLSLLLPFLTKAGWNEPVFLQVWDKDHGVIKGQFIIDVNEYFDDIVVIVPSAMVKGEIYLRESYVTGWTFSAFSKPASLSPGIIAQMDPGGDFEDVPVEDTIDRAAKQLYDFVKSGKACEALMVERETHDDDDRGNILLIRDELFTAMMLYGISPMISSTCAMSLRSFIEYWKHALDVPPYDDENDDDEDENWIPLEFPGEAGLNVAAQDTTVLAPHSNTAIGLPFDIILALDTFYRAKFGRPFSLKRQIENELEKITKKTDFEGDIYSPDCLFYSRTLKRLVFGVGFLTKYRGKLGGHDYDGDRFQLALVWVGDVLYVVVWRHPTASNEFVFLSPECVSFKPMHVKNAWTEEELEHMDFTAVFEADEVEEMEFPSTPPEGPGIIDTAQKLKKLCAASDEKVSVKPNPGMPYNCYVIAWQNGIQNDVVFPPGEGLIDATQGGGISTEDITHLADLCDEFQESVMGKGCEVDHAMMLKILGDMPLESKKRLIAKSKIRLINGGHTHLTVRRQDAIAEVRPVLDSLIPAGNTAFMRDTTTLFDHPVLGKMGTEESCSMYSEDSACCKVINDLIDLIDGDSRDIQDKHIHKLLKKLDVMTPEEACHTVMYAYRYVIDEQEESADAVYDMALFRFCSKFAETRYQTVFGYALGYLEGFLPGEPESVDLGLMNEIDKLTEVLFPSEETIEDMNVRELKALCKSLGIKPGKLLKQELVDMLIDHLPE